MIITGTANKTTEDYFTEENVTAACIAQCSNPHFVTS